MRFTDRLRAAAASIWREQLEHPFVRGIASGDLELSRFKHWVRQDYLFLIDYCRLLALAAARAPDLSTLTAFADLLHSTVRTEMDLHRDLARDFGVSKEELERAEMAPTTRAYTDFLIRTAAVGDYSELVAALLPCMWAFSEIGAALAQGPRPSDPRFGAWIDSYASEEFAALAGWCRDLVDGVAREAPAPALERMEAAFVASSRYELAFWEMAWRLEGAG